MKVLSWNVRGLGKTQTVNRLKNSLRRSNPQVLFLMETKLNARRMERVRHMCGYRFGVDVGSVGSMGGLSIGWKPECDVRLLSYSQFHIDVVIQESETLKRRFTGFYGRPAERDRDLSWNLLRQLHSNQSMPLLVAGDFNEIMYSYEKKGRRIRPERNMVRF
ncbi:hypothetical protein HRI_000461000 [Hibiscus trionum]|uniref:Endonuclease/exonuclease/phosphatase domain-containing protein n=1 Tax=Hibiscus trionum TaxID=183268 RepID=A0A9W7GZJ3_HIBTR|nr:hypothetical protein HRI_000461000 [Hibiscus trionum]